MSQTEPTLKVGLYLRKGSLRTPTPPLPQETAWNTPDQEATHSALPPRRLLSEKEKTKASSLPPANHMAVAQQTGTKMEPW